MITRAPGRLDCMGGMADFGGGLALQMPIDRAVYVAAGRRDDQRVVVHSIAWNFSGERSSHSWPLSVFYQSNGQFVAPGTLSGAFADCLWARHVAGVCLALLGSGELPHLAGGATLMIQGDIPPAAGLASSAALQVAIVKALATIFELDLNQHALVQMCRFVDCEVVGAPCGLVDHMTCLLGEADALLQIRCQVDEVLGVLPLPKEVIFAAVDVGLRLPIYEQRYLDNRISCLLGRHLIERTMGHAGNGSASGLTCLAGISPNQYVQRFRNELPVKMRGRDYIAAYGEPAGLEGQVRPDRMYKVRSRTEHHIYENDRTHRFMERLARARRTGERDALVEAGELMYASHWSYGQRCGMGSIETDVLANCIRALGPARGLYGAKVTAGGCGGAVAVLMANNPSALAALDEACAAYAEKTGKEPIVLIGSSPGAAAFGRRLLE